MSAKALNIISASRRTDIPAFYMPWLMNRLQMGCASYPNPFSGQVHTVSLQSNDVHSIVFWSKNYGRFLPYLDEIVERGYRFYFHYTITGVLRRLEPHVPDWQQSVQVFRVLAERTSPCHLQWRFDPVLFTHESGAEFYIERFRSIATALVGATRRCYFSFAIFYDKVKRQLQQAGIRFREPSLEEKQALVQAMADGRIGSIAELRRIVRRSLPPRVYEPAPSERWDEAYARLVRVKAQGSCIDSPGNPVAQR